jgi:anti-sigma28 factor (negative regulator of flagellin synthesis)
MRTLPPDSVEPVLSRQQQLLKLRERIERGEYEVDPGRVADAIVSRLLTAPDEDG